MTQGNVCILDYQAGNIQSMYSAVRYLGVEPRIISKVEEIELCDRLIFPGVGDAQFASEAIQSTGVYDAIRAFVATGNPLLGVCVGAQLLLSSSEEGGAKGLDIIPGLVKRFPKSVGKIPHMGWNQIAIVQEHPILDEVSNEKEVYFVHSFYMDPSNKEHIVTETEYNIRFASSIAHENVFGTQFHTEKSGMTGLKILHNFLMN